MRPAKVKSFTLLEILLSISVITVIAGLTLAVNQFLNLKNDLEMASISLTHSIREAQTRSTGGAGDSSWGVKAESGRIILFKGPSFGERDVGFDEETKIAKTIEIEGLSEITFGKVHGVPSGSGEINLKLHPYEKIITVNAKGIVSQQ